MRRSLLAALLLLPGCGEPSPAPRVEVVDLDGLKEALPRALGKGTLVNLWAMW